MKVDIPFFAPYARKNKRLAVLSNAEQYALYGLPDFDNGQQLEYLSLSETELALACSRPGLHAQIYCAVQIGYFKAKHAFFRFTWSETEDDVAFVLSRYFNDEVFEPKDITKHEHYVQRSLIAEQGNFVLPTLTHSRPHKCFLTSVGSRRLIACCDGVPSFSAPHCTHLWI